MRRTALRVGDEVWLQQLGHHRPVTAFYLGSGWTLGPEPGTYVKCADNNYIALAIRDSRRGGRWWRPYVIATARDLSAKEAT